MGVTIKDIALACGVSEGTVDRALNNRSGVSINTKVRILNTAREMDYQPNQLARSLALGKTMTLGVVLFDLSNRFFAELMNAIDKKAQELGYQVNLMLTYKDMERERKCIRNLIDRKVDGVILFSVNRCYSYTEFVKSTKIPFVTLGNRLFENWPHIWINDRSAMRDAALYILGKGYQRIIYVCSSLSHHEDVNFFMLEERFAGYHEGLEMQGIKWNEEWFLKDQHYLDRLKQMNLKQSTVKTAILCSCDAHALEVLNFLKGEGIDVPKDVGVMGFDNLDILKYVSPQLTTIHYPIEKIGIRAVECLQKLIAGNSDIEGTLFGHEVICGESI